MQAARLLEREEDLAALRARIGALRAQRAGATVLIEGPPGIGKSALLATALQDSGDLLVLRAHGTELEAGLAFGGVRQLFTPPLRRLSEDERDAMLAGPGALAARALGLGGPSPEGLSDPLYGLYWLVADLAERAPLIVAVDDLHWLDEESGRFIAYLAPRLEGVPLLLLATARAHEPGAADAPARVLADTGDVLRPAPLSAAAVDALVPGRPAAAVQAATGGNPLLVVEVARADPGAALEDIGPASVADSVLARVERVSADALALARAVALFGAGATLRDAATVAELDLPAAAAAADGLASASVLAGDDLLAFVHPLMRTAVYEALGTHARRAGHARAAAALRARGAGAEEVAAHVLAGEPAGDPDNVAVLQDAAARALAAIAPRAAVRYLARALAEPVAPGPEQTALLHQLGRLQAMLGRPEADATLAQALAQTTEATERIEIALELASVRQGHGDPDAAVAVLTPFVGKGELDAEHTLALDAMIAACALSATGHPRAFRDAVERLPADLPGDTPSQRFALIWKGWGSMTAEQPVAEIAELARRAIADDGSTPYFDLGNDLDDVSPLLLACGQLDVIEQLCEQRMAQALETGAEAAFAAAQTALAGVLHMRGHWLAAEAQLRSCIEHPAALPSMTTWCEQTLVEVLVMQERLDEADALLKRLTTRQDDIAALTVEIRRAQIACARGDYSRYEAFRQPADHFESLGMTAASATRWLCPYAEGRGRCGDLEGAIAVMELYLERALTGGDPASIGDAHTTLGRLKHGKAAIAHFEAACAALGPSPFRWLNGRAELDLGAALRRDNQRTRARDPLRCALDYAERHGSAEIARRAREELHLLGVRVHNAFLTGVESLTPAEIRIARLAAEGLTNREIAQRLFLTRKTVEMHMSRCLRKLDITSRKELPAALAA